MRKITERSLTASDRIWLDEPTAYSPGSVHKLMLARGIVGIIRSHQRPMTVSAAAGVHAKMSNAARTVAAVFFMAISRFVRCQSTPIRAPVDTLPPLHFHHKEVPREVPRSDFSQKLGVRFLAKLLKKLATPAGFEPATCGLEVRCSVQLSYGVVANKTLFLLQKSR